MGWGTTLFTNLYFSRATYRNKFEVEDALEEQKMMLENAKQDLRTYAYMTEPRKFMSNSELESSSPETWLRERVNDALSIIEDSSTEIYRLNLLLDRWDNCHDEQSGLAIDPPDNINWRSDFLCGDFVPSLKHPKTGTDGLQ